MRMVNGTLVSRILPSGLVEGSRSQLESVIMFQFIWFFLSLLLKIFSVIMGKALSLAVDLHRTQQPACLAHFPS